MEEILPKSNKGISVEFGEIKQTEDMEYRISVSQYRNMSFASHAGNT